jgi:hypothetical protein
MDTNGFLLSDVNDTQKELDKIYRDEQLQKLISEAINEQNHFWWGCVIGLQYGKLSVNRVGETEELSYCVNTEEQRQNSFQPIVRVKYGSPYEGREKVGHVVSWYDEVNHNPVNVAYLRRKPEPEIYETGATQHHINSLILYTDNTRELVELRDEIYNNHKYCTKLNPEIFIALCDAARLAFLRENGYDSEEAHPIDKMKYKKNFADVLEFCKIYVNRFHNWKIEHK